MLCSAKREDEFCVYIIFGSRFSGSLSFRKEEVLYSYTATSSGGVGSVAVQHGPHDDVVRTRVSKSRKVFSSGLLLLLLARKAREGFRVRGLLAQGFRGGRKNRGSGPLP